MKKRIFTIIIIFSVSFILLGSIKTNNIKQYLSFFNNSFTPLESVTNNVKKGKSYKIFNASEQANEMIKANFLSEFLLEEKNNLKYIHFTLLNYSNIKDIVFKIDNFVVGTTEYLSNDKKNKIYVLTLSNDSLSKKIDISGYVVPMGATINFTIQFDISNLDNITAEIPKLNYAPEFVPELTFLSDKKNYSVKINKEFSIPKATAKIGESYLDINVNVYMKNSTDNLKIVDNKVVFKKPGYYFIEYIAKTNLYKFSNGEDSFTRKKLLINVLDEDGIFKIKDDKTGIYLVNKNINNANLIVKNLKDANKKVVHKKFSKKSNFNFFNLTLLDDNGREIRENNNYIYFPINSTYKLDKTKLYYYENNQFKKMDYEIEDDYFKIKTNNLGSFLIIEENGVNFKLILGLVIPFTILILILVPLIIMLIIKKSHRVNKVT